MATTLQHAPSANTTEVPRSSRRRDARLGGALYLLTFAASIPALFLLGPVLNDADYIVSSGADARVTLGACLDVVNALACIGTAVALFPVLKRHNETLALGFVTARMFEAAVIAVGVLSLLTVVTLRQPGATGAEADALRVVGQSLVGVRDWTFLLGPNVMAGLNALLLGTLLYRSGLVPRVIPTLGLIGAPLLLAVTLATTFGLTEHGSAWWILVAPIFVWELSLGIYLLLKGFTHPSVPTSTHGDTKTTKSRRTLELPARCVQALGEHRAFMAGSGRPTGDDDLVFASQTGTALDAANVRREFRRVAATAGLDAAEWTPRELRHSFVSLLSSSGMPIEDIAHLVGHANTRVTELVYRKELRPVLTRGATAMDHLFPRD